MASFLLDTLCLLSQRKKRFLSYKSIIWNSWDSRVICIESDMENDFDSRSTPKESMDFAK